MRGTKLAAGSTALGTGSRCVSRNVSNKGVLVEVCMCIERDLFFSRNNQHLAI